MLAGPRRIPRTRARAVSPATGTVTDRARFWGALAEWRSPCRGQGSNTLRVRRALAAVFGGAVRKDPASRVWRKLKADWDAWNSCSLVEEPIVRLILDATVVRVRLDRQATSIVLLVVLGVRQDGQKVLLAVNNMGGETSQAWRAVLDNASSASGASRSS